jgi:hypothetical protein
MRNDHVGLQSDQLFREHAKPIRSGASETHVDADVPSFRPAESFQLPAKFRDACRRFRIVLGQPPLNGPAVAPLTEFRHQHRRFEAAE